MEFSSQEYWSGLPLPSPGDLPNPGMEPMSLVSPALAGGSFTTEPPGKPRRMESWHLMGREVQFCKTKRILETGGMTT